MLVLLAVVNKLAWPLTGVRDLLTVNIAQNEDVFPDLGSKCAFSGAVSELYTSEPCTLSLSLCLARPSRGEYSKTGLLVHQVH